MVCSNCLLTQQCDCILTDAHQQWVREDGLGTISTVRFLDLPADQSAMIENFLENTKSEVNPFRLAFLRWQLQAQLFKVLYYGSRPLP